MKKLSSFSCINGFALKLIALIAMTIDHTAYVFQCGSFYWPMRYIGRIAFPIYCFLLVEGYFHTGNVKRYAGRLAVMALVSELPFDLMCGQVFPTLQYQNVMFTLLLGLCAIWLLDHGEEWVNERVRGPMRQRLLSTLFGVSVLFGMSALGDLLETDYHGGGVLLIIAFYLLRGRMIPLILASGIGFLYFYGTVELYGLFAFLPIALYNGRRGPMPGGKAGQWFFYWYYPLHIAVLVVLSAALGMVSYQFLGNTA